jgi:hypothetical protein
MTGHTTYLIMAVGKREEFMEKRTIPNWGKW